MLSKRSATALTSAILLFTATCSLARVIYVDDDAGGANDGSSWAHAYRYLQDALTDANVAPEGVEIRVAQGVYKPDRGAVVSPGDREATFRIPRDIAMVGGYAGLRGPDPDARDVGLYETILSGDLGSDDSAVTDPCDLLTEPTRVDNSRCIVTMKGVDEYDWRAAGVLDGLTISSGNAIDPSLYYLEQHGAGLEVWTSPSIRTCTFIGNCAFQGGGVHLVNGCPEFTGCRFLRNAATWGGALRRTATRGGGDGMQTVAMKRCVFADNCALEEGGAISFGAYRLDAEECVFTDNSAQLGGAVYWGAYILNMGNCLLVSNSARLAGGGVYLSDRELNITCCTFYGNEAQHGNAVACLEDRGDREDPPPPSARVTSTIFRDGGDEIYIVWDRVGLTVTYSNVQDGWPGESNTGTDPLFADPVDQDYHLESEAGRWDPASESWVIDEVTSPCIDAGDPNSPIGPEPFPNGGRVNMGVYGGTAEASKSYFDAAPCETIIAGDINGDCKVDFTDLAILMRHWLEGRSE